ncbi:MAG: hypothetical protein E6J39_06335 [Chloroflexi bacterium]|nr:MAG: hypothetical protein E6J39_06335 [Chloroflexota bacterium]
MKHLLLVATIFLVACSGQLPKPECDPAETRDSVLRCNEAVNAAFRALPHSHPPITRIQFGYGSVTPWRGAIPYPSGDQPVYGYVVFTWGDGSRRQYVDLTVWRGALTVGTLTPYDR